MVIVVGISGYMDQLLVGIIALIALGFLGIMGLLVVSEFGANGLVELLFFVLFIWTLHWLCNINHRARERVKALAAEQAEQERLKKIYESNEEDDIDEWYRMS